MSLTLFMKIWHRGRLAAVGGGVALASFALAGCISSTAPILGDAKAILGEQIDLYLFAPRAGGAAEGGLRHSGVATVQWNGGRYVVRSRGDLLTDFTIHAFEGRDLIVQTVPRAPRPVEYALARRLSDGVYMVVAIDEDVVDEPTRAKFCTKTQEASCRITTPEQLFVFARAMADNAEGRTDAGIAVVVPSERR
jgi:hypothetical protein